MANEDWNNCINSLFFIRTITNHVYRKPFQRNNFRCNKGYSCVMVGLGIAMLLNAHIWNLILH